MDASTTLVDYLPFLLMGIPVTLEVTVLSMALALPVALVLALGRSAPHAWLRWPAGFVIELFRGSSSLVQLFWAFYVLPLFGMDLPALVAGVLVLGLNEGSYLSEVFRAGFASVPEGQREASLTLGFSPYYRFFRVTLPQALPVMIPPFGNALIVMLKFSSLVSLVTIRDLSFRADLIATSLGESAVVFGVVMAIYYALALMLSALARQLEAAVDARVGRQSKGFRLSARVNVPQWAIGAKS